MSRIEPTLFISHSYRDKEIVKKLADGLLSNGIRAQHNDTLIKADGDWQDRLTNVLVGVDCILALITPNSTDSEQVMNELGMVRSTVNNSNGQKLFISVVYGEVDIPDLIKDIQVIFWKDNYKEVVNHITNAIFSFIEKRYDKILAQEELSRNEITQDIIGKNERDKHGKVKKLSSTRNAEKRNYWFLKMNPETWPIEQFSKGYEIFFQTHYLERQRPEHKVFEKITKDDYVIGFASGDYQSVVCEMMVVKPVGLHQEQGKSFTMVVNRLVKPHIPLNIVRNKIPHLLLRFEQYTEPPELFFELTEIEYKEILSSDSGKQDETFKNNYQPFFLNEGNHETTKDQLDFENDYDSFATVIALRRVSPPLAIGLFGNWGSGKSFFMEKLSERIDEIIREKNPDYVEHVVSVKFNSWHYSDTNLWASLTTQIFESLNDYAQKKEFGEEAIEAIYKNLNIIGHQLEETKKKLKTNEVLSDVLKQQKDEKDEIIRKKKETLDLWQARDFVKIVFSDPFIQKDFREIKEQFKGENFIDNVGEIEKAYAEIDTTVSRVWKSFVLLKEKRTGNWIWIWIFAALFGAVGYLALGPLEDMVNKYISGTYVATGLFVAWVSDLAKKLFPYYRKINQFYNRLKSLKDTVEKEKVNVNLKEYDEIQRLEKDIVSLMQEKTKLEIVQKRTEDKKKKLQNEIEGIGSGKLLANFLTDKSIDDSYIKQLGIISWIRKDFSKLNELFQNQEYIQTKENDNTAAVQIDRIVLYIDDLDRCNEDVVVKVLEAIHLLLAFPLFVVVVGVDPRWLNNALSKKYKNLFGNQNSKNIEKGDPSVQVDQFKRFGFILKTLWIYIENSLD